MTDDRLTEKVLTRQVLHSGRIFRTEQWTVSLPDGQTALRQVAALYCPAAAVVAIDSEDRVLLVRQYRAAMERLTLQLPAGKLDGPDEDPLAAAARELGQETGMEAGCWQALTCLEPTPAFCSERIYLYMATELRAGDAHPDEGEYVDVLRLPLTEALSMVMNGTIRDGKTVAGLLMAARLRSSAI